MTLTRRFLELTWCIGSYGSEPAGQIDIPIMNYLCEVMGQKEWPTLEKLNLQAGLL